MDKQWKYPVGTTVYHKFNGKGVVKDIDPFNSKFRYNVVFEDGTHSWKSERSLFLEPFPEEKEEVDHE